MRNTDNHEASHYAICFSLLHDYSKLLNIVRLIVSLQFQLRQAHRELEKLRVVNGSLGERIEILSAQSSSPGPRSLLHEMECDDGDDVSRESERIVRSNSSSEQLVGVSCMCRILSFSAPQLSHDIPAATGFLCDEIAVLRDMSTGMPKGKTMKSYFEDSDLQECARCVISLSFPDISKECAAFNFEVC